MRGLKGFENQTTQHKETDQPISPLVVLPEFWHFLTFCHSNFRFEHRFRRNPIGYSVCTSGNRTPVRKLNNFD